MAPVCIILVFLGIAIVAIWSRTAAKRMGLRIQDDLSRTPTAADLTSIETWIKIDEAEQKKHPGSVWAPPLVTSGLLSSEWTPSPSSDDYVTLIDLGVLMDRSRGEFAPVTLGDLPTRLFRIKYDGKTRKKTGWR